VPDLAKETIEAAGLTERASFSKIGDGLPMIRSIGNLDDGLRFVADDGALVLRAIASHVWAGAPLIYLSLG
jgi:hypothetical protein